MSKKSVSNSVQIWTAIWLRAVHKAWADEVFAGQLVEDPKRALKDEFNYDFPKNLGLKVRAMNYFEALPEAKDINLEKFFGGADADDTSHTLTVPLLPKPHDAQDQLTWLSKHKSGPMVACICMCW